MNLPRVRPLPSNSFLLLGWICLAACEPLAARAEELHRLSRTEVHMGVEFEVVLYAPSVEQGEAAAKAAFERIAKLDQLLSDYNLDTELSKLSASAPTTMPVPLSPELCAVLTASQSLAAESEGAFDVTIGPLTKLWRRARRQKELPPADMLRAALAAVGHKNLVVDPARQTAQLKVPRMRLDLGGIAKGYAVDEALKALAQRDIRRALVRASGDIVAGDPPPDAPGWKIGLAPLNPEETPKVFVSLKNQAISTSGEARQHLVVDGRRYSHLIDPRTGEPLHGRMSVTIVAPRCIDADGLASAVAVLGPEKGLRLVEQRAATSAYLITADDKGENVQTHISRHFTSDPQEAR